MVAMGSTLKWFATCNQLYAAVELAQTCGGCGKVQCPAHWLRRSCACIYEGGHFSALPWAGERVWWQSKYTGVIEADISFVDRCACDLERHGTVQESGYILRLILLLHWGLVLRMRVGFWRLRGPMERQFPSMLCGCGTAVSVLAVSPPLTRRPSIQP